MLNALLVASLCLVWGATWIVIKIGLTESPPFYAAAIRFVIAAGILGAIALWRKPKWPKGRRLWAWIGFSAFLMYTGSYAVTYFVEQYINAGLTAILFASFPFFVSIGAHYFLPGERLSLFKVIGLVIGFTGVVVLFTGGATAPSTRAWWAPALMLLSPLTSAVSNIIVKRHLTQEDPVVLNLIQMSMGVVFLLALATGFENYGDFKWNATSMGAVLFLAVFGSAFAFVTLYHLLRTTTASRLSLIAFVTPNVAALLDWLVLGDTPTLATGVGAALVLVGIYIVNILAERRKKHLAVTAVEAADCTDT
jgi:drug/metabolite transporter (DMT)-like permease